MLFEIHAQPKSPGTYFTHGFVGSHRIHCNGCHGTHTPSETIDNSSTYERDWTITTSPPTSSTPYSKGWRRAPSCSWSFYYNSRSNKKTQPFHRLAIDPIVKTRQRKTETEKNGERPRTRGFTGSSWLTRSFPLTGPKAKSFRKCQKREFWTGIFL